eukprot:SAG11_NODE_2532_length_3247_cov_1.482211_2_plen_450_part_00
MHTATVAPNAPYPPSVAGYANSSAIELRWDAVAAHAGAPVTSVRLWQDGSLDSTHAPTGAAVEGLRLSQLAVDTEYRYELSALNDWGESDRSAPVVLYTAPRAPTAAFTVNQSAVGPAGSFGSVVEYSTVVAQGGPAAVNYANSTSAFVRWEEPVAQSAPVLEHNLWVRRLLAEGEAAGSDGEVGEEWSLNAVVDAPAAEGRVSGLSGGRKYAVEVTARNIGGESERLEAGELVVYTAPAAPQLTHVLSGSESIALAWAPVASHVDAPLASLQLHFHRVAAPGVEDDAEDTTVLELELDVQGADVGAELGLLDSTLYSFTLRVENFAGSQESAVLQLGTAPPKIGVLSSSNVAAYYFMITWPALENPPSDQLIDERLAVIRYSIVALDLETEAALATHALYGSNGQVLAGLRPDADYNCSVAAINGFGTGTYSDPITVRTLPGAGGGLG